MTMENIKLYKKGLQLSLTTNISNITITNSIPISNTLHQYLISLLVVSLIKSVTGYYFIIRLY